MSITSTYIIGCLYCPRFTYYEYVPCFPQYQERHYKVEKGRAVYELKPERNKDYQRKLIGQLKHNPCYLRYIYNGIEKTKNEYLV